MGVQEAWPEIRIYFSTSLYFKGLHDLGCPTNLHPHACTYNYMNAYPGQGWSLTLITYHYNFFESWSLLQVALLSPGPGGWQAQTQRFSLVNGVLLFSSRFDCLWHTQGNPIREHVFLSSLVFEVRNTQKAGRRKGFRTVSSSPGRADRSEKERKVKHLGQVHDIT